MIILSDDVENSGMPWVNWLLIMLNFFGLLWILGQTSHLNQAYYDWGTVPGRFLAHHDLHDFIAIVTSMFLHVGPLHFLGNMWVLFLFGDNVEDRLGHFSYFAFYLCCGLFADMLHIFSDPHSLIPAVGASGAIAGVMGAYLALHPNAKCKTWWGDDLILFGFRTYNVPALFVIGGWFMLQILCLSLTSASASGVAFYAHIGGFLAGMGLLAFIRYNKYEVDGSQSWGRSTCAIAFIIFLVLSGNMVSGFMRNKEKITTIQVAHEETPVKVKPAVSAKPKAKHSKIRLRAKAKSPPKTATRRTV